MSNENERKTSDNEYLNNQIGVFNDQISGKDDQINDLNNQVRASDDQLQLKVTLIETISQSLVSHVFSILNITTGDGISTIV